MGEPNRRRWEYDRGGLGRAWMGLRCGREKGSRLKEGLCSGETEGEEAGGEDREIGLGKSSRK